MTPELLQSRGNCTSASNALADSLCPGRHQAQLGLPEPEASEEAKAGTRIHEWLAGEYWNARGPIDKPACFSESEIEIAKLLNEKMEGFKLDFFKRNGCVSCYPEHRMWIQFGSIAHSGQADLVLVGGTCAAILDAKTGWGDVPDSDTNLQLRDLAVLAWRNFPKIKSVEVAIIDRFRDPIVTRYELPDLRRAEKELKARVKASNAKNPRRIPGPVQCKFCRAFGTERCPESTALVHSIAKLSDPTIGGVPTVLMPPEQLVAIQKIKSLVLKRCESVTTEIRRRLQEDPASVPGASLAKPKVLRPITDPDTVFERATALGVPRYAIMKAVKMTKGPLEDGVSYATGLSGKALDEKMAELLAGCTAEKVCEPEVVVE